MSMYPNNLVHDKITYTASCDQMHLNIIIMHPYKTFGMTLLQAHARYTCIVCAKYQKASVKTLVQVDFLMYALSKHKHNPYLIGVRNKWLSSQSYYFVKIHILASNFFTQMFNVSVLCKQSISFFQHTMCHTG